MNHRILAAAVLLAAPNAVWAKTEAIMAFDSSGAEAVRYYSREGKARRALGESDPAESGLKVDPIGKSPEVTAIVVSVNGQAVGDADEIEGKLFAFGDTVNARVRQASGGRRSIHGRVVGPVPVDPTFSCDLGGMFEAARKGSQADLSKTEVVVVIAPKESCRYSGASTLGRVAIGGRKLAVAWAFGDAWVEAAAHALEHAMGARHAAELASETFGFDTAPKTAAAPKPARKPRAVRVARAPKKEAPKADYHEPLLGFAAVTELIEQGTPEAAPSDLRDAPAALRAPMPGIARVPVAAMGGARAIETVRPRPQAPKPQAVSPAKPSSIDAASCREGVRNLREAVKAASAKGSKAAALVARKRLAEALKRQRSALAAKDPSDDVEVSLLTTDAETELHVAILRIEDPKLGAKAFAAEVVPSVERAARSLEEAAKRLSGRKS